MASSQKLCSATTVPGLLGRRYRFNTLSPGNDHLYISKTALACASTFFVNFECPDCFFAISHNYSPPLVKATYEGCFLLPSFAI